MRLIAPKTCLSCKSVHISLPAAAKVQPGDWPIRGWFFDCGCGSTLFTYADNVIGALDPCDSGQCCDCRTCTNHGEHCHGDCDKDPCQGCRDNDDDSDIGYEIDSARGVR